MMYAVYVKKIRIDEEGLEAFRLTLPEAMRHECFKFVATYYDVVKALYLIKKLGMEPRPVNVKNWAEGLGLDGPADPDGTKVNFLCGVTDKEALTDSIDTSIPVVVAVHSYRDKKRKLVQGAVLIDGNKRLRKAFVNGLETIPGYGLTADLTALIKEN